MAGEIPFVEAVRHWASKQVLPTGRSSAEIARDISAAVRRQSVFSARTTMASYLDTLKETIESVVNPKQVATTEDRGQGTEDGSLQMATVTEGLNPATAREVLRGKLEELGYRPDPEVEGTLLDLSSDKRLDLVVKTNTELAQGAGKFVQSNLDEDVVDLWPAWELVRYEGRDEPRDWAQRWRLACQVAGDPKAAAALELHGRMAALKSSGVWQALGDGEGGYLDTLGNPYPPFAFNSGMWTEDVSRAEAVELGLIGEEEEARPAELELGSLFGAEDGGQRTEDSGEGAR